MSASPPSYASLPFSTLLELMTKLDEHVQPQHPTWFSINTFAGMLILYALAKLLHLVLPRACGRRRWEAVSPTNRKTMVIYVLQITVTLAAFALQMASASLAKFEFTARTLEMERAGVTLVAMLYVFELVYRDSMRGPMIAHHIITVFIMSLAMTLVYTERDPSFALTGWLWLFQATTEQLTFVSLFLYRLKINPRTLRILFRVSAVQAFACKAASIAGTVYVWAKWQRTATGSRYRAFDVIFFVATVGLAATQVWGTYVVWIMGNRGLRADEQPRMSPAESQELQSSTPCSVKTADNYFMASDRLPECLA
ncbi:hypothetical protein FA09DRAFT_338468 [Tilletiopsis washingtonensis]|uniref:TLC domain-containing protein n=1 Tax=Tilletiopsis washingtonensis TaxID=58919 RepID=A0A316ZBF8_9BASI|nr:hypothetical protein FA09DRAFT_338468 [Tilletiopsis washingtonensis]PWN98626.1 hypothetical protein FA09DRAFT_338468 [Tilletiopsis washingtonensis]